jgi:hypothetical protein
VSAWFIIIIHQYIAVFIRNFLPNNASGKINKVIHPGELRQFFYVVFQNTLGLFLILW